MPLASLRVFVATAEQLSFSRAAAVLGVTIGAVSMQIRALEEYLRAPLFRRRGRVVRPTGEGERLLPKVRASLEALERAIDEARVDGRSGPLMVSMLASFLQQWLLHSTSEPYCSLAKVEAFRAWITKQAREAPRPRGIPAS